MFRWSRLPVAHAAYLIGTGVFPVLAPRAYARLTGQKGEMWLVKSVGVMSAALGLALAAATRDGHADHPAVRRFAAATSLAGAATALPYALRGRVHPVYIPDGLVHSAFVVGWIANGRRDGAEGAGRGRPGTP